MELANQQKDFFQTFGFLKFPGLFSDDIERITNTFERIWSDHGGGHQGETHDYQRRSALLQFIDQDEYMSSLIDDPRLDGMASGILGDDYNYVLSDGNFYVGDTQWHSDYRIPKPSIKAAFYLDEVAAESGALRVIPGSHMINDNFSSTLHEIMPSGREANTQALLGIYGDQVPAVALESKPGDLVCFDRRIKHASFGGSSRRRMFTIVFEPHYEDNELEKVHDHIGSLSRFWCDRAYGETMIRTASPQRMVHLEQRLANDSHLAELTRKARLEMKEPARG